MFICVYKVCIYGCSDEGCENGDGVEGNKISDVDDFLCGKSEEDLRAILGRFVEMCKRRGLKANASNSKVMVPNGKEGLECKVCVDGMQLKHVSEFKYLGCVLDESGTDEAEYCRNVVGGEGEV